MIGNNIAILVFTLISLALFGLIILRIRKDLQTLPNDKLKISEINKEIETLKGLFSDDTKYFRYSWAIPIKEKLQSLKIVLANTKNLLLLRERKRKIQALDEFYNNFEAKRKEANEDFISKEKERCRNIFRDGNKDLLTDEQIQAVLSEDDRNLIVAGAGSGKTKVIDFKVRYLINIKKISPEKIVLLSFSRKSAADLIRKISEHTKGVEVRTIHAFSAQMLGDKDIELFNDNNREMELLVLKALAETITEKNAFSLFTHFYENYFYDLKPLIFYTKLDDLRDDLRKANSKLILSDDKFEEIKAERALKTLKGEFVRSIDERYIADFLYLHEIEYQYEKRYPHCDESYHPDFYLTQFDVYLEHFAITKDGRPPSYFKDPQKYLDGIKWKQNLHKSQNTRMIETYSYLLNAGETSDYLKKVFSDSGISIKMSKAESKAYNVITREFSKLFVRFYNSFKLSGFLLEDLRSKFAEPHYSLFLEIFERFLGHYARLTNQEGKIDYSDLILKAIDTYREQMPKKHEYIIIDEFQDTSSLAMNLLNLVHNMNPGSVFFAVGDDWQSIYGFNGSDVTILSDFEKKYEGVSVRYLNNNFRSHSRIVDLGKQFVSKNPSQLQKNVVSQNSNFSKSEIDFIDFDQMLQKIDQIPDDESILVLYRYNDDCPAGRDGFNDHFYFNEYRKPVKRRTCKKNMSMMTIHGSKGLEARHVFFLFPDGTRRKFPSEIEDHFVFIMLKNRSDAFPFSEERRLMYVAITRAEQNLYFVAPNGRSPNSVFWDELKELVNFIK